MSLIACYFPDGGLTIGHGRFEQKKGEKGKRSYMSGQGLPLQGWRGRVISLGWRTAVLASSDRSSLILFQTAGSDR